MSNLAPKLPLRAALLLCLLSAVSAQVCPPKQGTPSNPQPSGAAICAPQEIEKEVGSAPGILTAFPADASELLLPNGGAYDVLSWGIPFYVYANDLDRIILNCKREESNTKKDLKKNDVLTYSFALVQGNLPGPGEFEVGSERTAATVAVNHSAVVYKLPAGLKYDEPYSFTVRCDVVDTGDGADDGLELKIEWDISILVKKDTCEVELTISRDQLPAETVYGSVTLPAGPCCTAQMQYDKGMPISQVKSTSARHLAAVGEFLSVSAMFSDTDLIKRTCDDVPDVCGTSVGTRVDFVSCGDRVHYVWSAHKLDTTVTPPTWVSAGIWLPPNPNEHAVLWRPLEPGDYRLCVVGRNNGIQAADEDYSPGFVEVHVSPNPIGAVGFLSKQPGAATFSLLDDCSGPSTGPGKTVYQAVEQGVMDASAELQGANLDQ